MAGSVPVAGSARRRRAEGGEAAAGAAGWDSDVAAPTPRVVERASSGGVLALFALVVLAAAFLGRASVRSSAALRRPQFYKGVRRELGYVVADDVVRGAKLLRLAWHSAATYDRHSRTGGSMHGTLRFGEELGHAANAGLDEAVRWLEPIRRKYAAQGLQHGDLYTLAGATALEALGGPRLQWRAGRIDAGSPAQCPAEGRLLAPQRTPKEAADHLRQVYNRLGFNDREIVALSGAYALGYTFVNPEEFPGFSNAYYRALVTLGCEWGGECAWEETTDAAGRAAYLSGGAASTQGRYLMYLADLVLATDPGFRTYVQLYADRNDVWKRDLKHALEILLELGCVGLYPVPLQ